MTGIWLASYLVLWLFVLLQALLVFFLYRELGVRMRNSTASMNRQGLAVGTKVPQLELLRPNGTRFLVPSDGQRTLIVFGSRRCQPCRELVPHLNRFAAEKEELAQFLFVLEESPLDAEVTARELGISVDIGCSREALQSYNASVTPFAFLVDEGGIVQAKGLVNSRQGLDLLWRQGGGDARGPKKANGQMAASAGRVLKR